MDGITCCIGPRRAESRHEGTGRFEERRSRNYPNGLPLVACEEAEQALANEVKI